MLFNKASSTITIKQHFEAFKEYTLFHTADTATCCRPGAYSTGHPQFYHPFANPGLYDIETNNSYAEDFQNLKWIMMMMALVLIAMVRQEKNISHGYWFSFFVP
ncbi:hypothetical protein KRR40_39240 [Niabella defluvii]|nr:hypothetical protein KRR40_39240 [Niabella sp. I65]